MIETLVEQQSVTYYLDNTPTHQSVPQTYRGSEVIMVKNLTEIAGYEAERPEAERGNFRIGLEDGYHASLVSDYTQGNVPDSFKDLDTQLVELGVERPVSYSRTIPFFEAVQLAKESGRYSRTG